jgi:hypothetical protein
MWHYLWIARLALQATLLVVLVLRQSYKHFPIFLAYTSWAVVRSVTLLGMNYAPSVTGNQYYRAFMVGAVVDTALNFGIIYEIFTQVLFKYPAVKHFGTVLLRWLIVILLLIAIALAWLVPGTGAGHRMSVFYVIQRTANLLQVGLLLFLFIFSRFLRLSWRSNTFGIALGFGILATMSLATAAIRSQVEPIAANLTTDLLTMISEGTYLCSVLVWIAYMLAREPRPHVFLKTLPKHDLETWNRELQRLLHQ